MGHRTDDGDLSHRNPSSCRDRRQKGVLDCVVTTIRIEGAERGVERYGRGDALAVRAGVALRANASELRRRAGVRGGVRWARGFCKAARCAVVIRGAKPAHRRSPHRRRVIGACWTGLAGGGALRWVVAACRALRRHARPRHRHITSCRRGRARSRAGRTR